MIRSRPRVTVRLPSAPGSRGNLLTAIGEALNAVVEDRDPLDIEFQSADDGVFSVSVGGRPALIEMRDELGSDDERVDSVSSRLLRRLPLWYGDDVGLDDLAHGLADLGVDPRRGDPDRWSAEEPLSAGHALEQALVWSPASLRIEVPASVARRIDDRGLNAMTELRANLFERTGVTLPELTVEVTEPLLPRLRLRLNDVTITVRHLPPDARWIDVVDRVGRLVEPRMHWFIRQSEVERALTDLEHLIPDLVGAARDRYSIETLTGTLRLLLQHGANNRYANSRNLARVLWLLLELSTVESGADQYLMAEEPLLSRPGEDGSKPSDDPLILMSRVRKCVAEEAWRAGLKTTPAPSGRLPAQVEARLVEAADPAELAAAEWDAIKDYGSIGSPRALIVGSVEAIRPVFTVLQALQQPPVVIAEHELPPDTAEPWSQAGRRLAP